MRDSLRILVTGGCGFIGTHAVHRWAARHEVLALDNLSRPGAACNLDWLRARHSLAFRRIDIRDAEEVTMAVRSFRPDVVVHLAGQVAVTTSVTDPGVDFAINAQGTFNVLEAVRRHAADSVMLYSSTNKVYGSMEDVGVVLRDGRYTYADHEFGVDEDQPLDFHSPYGCSKGAGDQYVRDYARIYGLRTVVLRQSCIYGTRQFGMEDQGWVAWFTIRAVQGQPVTVFGDGRQVRDVLWVDDLIDAYERAIARIETARGRVYNLGGGPDYAMSLLELLDLLRAQGGAPVRHDFADWRPGDQRVFVADIRRAQAELGWHPQVTPAEGVSRLYEWVEQNRHLFDGTGRPRVEELARRPGLLVPTDGVVAVPANVSGGRNGHQDAALRVTSITREGCQ
jgi:CDP-paratose 2-epimerase